ncbi:hypothetical protein DF186_24450, partial [Enterococcus hirae]
MYLTDVSDVSRCKVFSIILIKMVIKWFDSLLLRLIISFDDFVNKFLIRFFIQKDKVKYIFSLLELNQ